MLPSFAERVSRWPKPVQRACPAVLVWATLMLLAPSSADAGQYHVLQCSRYGNAAPMFSASTNAAMTTADACVPNSTTGYSSLEIQAPAATTTGDSAGWTATTPSPLLNIVGVYTPSDTVFADCALASDGFTATFLWSSGRQAINLVGSGASGNLCPADGISVTIPSSRWFAWASGCYLRATCTEGGTGSLLYVRGIDLTVEEDTGPTITPTSTSLVNEDGQWVRGTWPLAFTTNDPSGVCSTKAVVDGFEIDGAGSLPDRSQWQQCPQLGYDQSIDTSQYPDGPMPLQELATNAAIVTSTGSQTVNVDNQPVNLSMSGPTDAPSTAGTQYVTATATAGPSGVSGITCSTDGAPLQWYPGATASIPVQGLGAQQVSCVAQNNASDSSGAAAYSQWQNFDLSIRQPSLSTVSFAHIARALRCTTRRQRIHVPGRWIFERIHGHRVRVRVPAQTRTVKVTHCRGPASRRGARSTRRIRFGRPTVVSGWVGTSDAVALPGATVRVMTAPDNGSSRFQTALTTTTNADGVWTATLPAGPSRLIHAEFDGSGTVEPAVSPNATVIVKGRTTLTIRPHATRWGGRIRISGRLHGGYIPRGGELVVLWIGWRGGSAEIGHLYARRNGTFSTPYTFLRGNGTVTYHVWATPARESSYPFAPTRSRAAPITVRP
jgi:hypothetical protein